MNFGTKFAQKRYSQSTEKVNVIEFCIIELAWVPNFRLNLKFWFFQLNLPGKDKSGLKQKNYILACLHDCCWLCSTLPHGDQQRQRYFKVSSSSRANESDSNVPSLASNMRNCSNGIFLENVLWSSNHSNYI